MTLPTPVTTSSIIKLNASSLRPKFTLNAPMASQLTETSRASQPPNLMRASESTKLVHTALMDSVALTARLRWVNNVINPVATSGRNKMNQANASSFISGNLI